ncbi:MAG TPA: Imm15 family immunity protein [Amycolatopsis sp.]|uniref:Imm15 family immunity protein n=1 Tax=Amycolatopsis sp. TaxID=37632 RepID=UPI002B4717B5|nr:Imm15 family immunity protein [Amycolatopsis sp.]HKS47835.1 Imm15 family immunity protein [Amycolatopsis sp.]
MAEIDPRFRQQLREVMELNEVWDPRGLMAVPAGGDTYEELPLFATLREVEFLGDLPVPEQNRVLIQAAAAHLRVILDYAAERESNYFCAVTIDFWDDFDDGGLITPRFLYANPAREFFGNLTVFPAKSGYSGFTSECLDHSPEYVLHEQLDPFGVTGGLPESAESIRVESVWVEHTSCQVPESVVAPDPRP